MKSWLLVFFYRHEVQERKPTYLLLYHYTAQATRWEFSYWLQEILTINILQKGAFMREKTKKLSSILLCLVFCFSFSTAVYAASYIYYDGGLKSATVDVENRLSNSRNNKKISFYTIPYNLQNYGYVNVKRHILDSFPIEKLLNRIILRHCFTQNIHFFIKSRFIYINIL